MKLPLPKLSLPAFKLPPVPKSLAGFRTLGIAAGVTAALLLGGWAGVWVLASGQFGGFIDRWIAQRSAAGYQVHYDSRETIGFPQHIILRFKNFVLENSDGIKIHADELSLATLPWHWNMMDAKGKHGFDITIPFGDDKTIVLSSPDETRSHIELDAGGDWRAVDLTLSHPQSLWGGKPFFAAETIRVGLARPALPPKDHSQPGLSLNAAAENLVLPEEIDAPFGRTVQKLDAQLRIMGEVPDPRHRSAVNVWNTGGGSVEFDRLELNWGPLLFATRGTLALDDDLQPEGAFSSVIANHGELLKVLIDNGVILQRQAGMLDSALILFAKRQEVAGQTGIEVPIAVQLGGLFLGPVRVFYFPQIDWDGAAVPAAAAPVLPETPAAQAAPAEVAPATPPAEATPAPSVEPAPLAPNPEP